MVIEHFLVLAVRFSGSGRDMRGERALDAMTFRNRDLCFRARCDGGSRFWGSRCFAGAVNILSKMEHFISSTNAGQTFWIINLTYRLG